MDCRCAERHLSAYVDGELEPSPMLELEDHLTVCADCRAEHDFLHALQSELKAQLQPAAAPPHVRARVLRALADVHPESEHDHATMHGFMTAAAIAASVLLVLGSVFGTDKERVQTGSAAEVSSVTTAGLEFVHDIVDRHKDELPTEIATQMPEQATSWFRNKLNFQVHAVEFAEPKVQLRGARISQVGLQQAAKLYYSVGDSRLTLVVFKAPPSLAHMLASQSELERWGAHRAHVGNHDVTYHTLQGYTVPIVQQNGIVYAFAGDLDQGSLLHLVANARIPY